VNDSLRVETVASLASRLGLTRDAVVREVVAGRMPYVNVGGHWRFRESDIAYWTKHHGGAGHLRVVEPRRAGSA
jgi:excisionase family DNA binding protein